MSSLEQELSYYLDYWDSIEFDDKEKPLMA